jgi:hypothetical protein
MSRAPRATNDQLPRDATGGGGGSGGSYTGSYGSVHKSGGNPTSYPSYDGPVSRSSVQAVPGQDINASMDGGRTPWILRELKVNCVAL